MRNISFFAEFSKKSGSSIIRAKQVSEYLGAKLNPNEGYEDDVCIYVKQMPPKNCPKNSYLDIVDHGGLANDLKKRPDIKAIAISQTAYSYLNKRLDNVVLIPQHHCNYERIKRNRNKVKTVGIISTPASMQYSIVELKEKFKNIGLEFKMQNFYRSREDVVEFYKTIDVQIIWRLKNWPLKNSLKIVNAASFGIPTIAFPINCYQDMEGYYTRANTIDDLLKEVENLKNNSWNSERLINKAGEYHISNIALLYKKLY